MSEITIQENIVSRIDNLIKRARQKVAYNVNNIILKTYMEIGKIIVEEDLVVEEGYEYKKKSLRSISRILSQKYGKGFSIANLHFMAKFYRCYKSVQTLSKHLSWSHYCEILSIDDKSKRDFYEKECLNAKWSVRELRRQIKSCLFERLLLSSGKTNKEKIAKLAAEGNEIATPEDIIKDPYVFEFIGIPENKPFLESDLENALINQIEKFLLELGKGFMYVGSQQRVTFNNIHYYVDMVFYNKILKSYVLIELKTSKLTPEVVGQINMYLNYYASEINEENDNPPIGIILCAEKGNVDLEYALGGLNNQIFASRYTMFLPKKEDLIAQVEMLLKIE